MKAELEHGSYEATVKRHMTQPTAHKYRAIAKDEILSNHAHGHALPPSWRTLYELTHLPDDLKLACIKPAARLGIKRFRRGLGGLFGVSFGQLGILPSSPSICEADTTPDVGIK
jgi:hypothetical protein